MNTVKTVLLLGILSGVLLVGGEAVAGREGLYVGLMFCHGLNFFSYFFSEKLALMTYSAQPVTPEQNHVFMRARPDRGRLAARMNIPMPKLWLIPDNSPNVVRRPAATPTRVSCFHERHFNLMSDRRD